MPPEQLPAPEPSAAEIRDTADEILRRAEFQPPKRALPLRIWDWVRETLATFFDRLTSTSGASIVAWLVLIAALVLLALLVRRFRRTLAPNPVATQALITGRRRTAAEWRSEADAHEARGEWRAAMRSRYRALLADLAARGVVDEVPGRTTGDHRRQVDTKLPGAAGDFSGASELFERAWYGDVRTGPEEAARFRELADRVLEGSAR
jgi:hypothetical protein